MAGRRLRGRPRGAAGRGGPRYRARGARRGEVGHACRSGNGRQGPRGLGDPGRLDVAYPPPPPNESLQLTWARSTPIQGKLQRRAHAAEPWRHTVTIKQGTAMK